MLVPRLMEPKRPAARHLYFCCFRFCVTFSISMYFEYIFVNFVVVKITWNRNLSSFSLSLASVLLVFPPPRLGRGIVQLRSLLICRISHPPYDFSNFTFALWSRLIQVLICLQINIRIRFFHQNRKKPGLGDALRGREGGEGSGQAAIRFTGAASFCFRVAGLRERLRGSRSFSEPAACESYDWISLK